MKAPDFWYERKPALAARLLAPLGFLYARATANWLATGQPVDPGVPVLCIGNLNAGGTGKTPVVDDLARRLSEKGRAVHVISKGYGREPAAAAEPVRVDAGRHAAREVGDEPLMLARRGRTVWVCPDRTVAAHAAVQAGAEMLILDDGLQDPSLKKTLSFVVVDGTRGFGNTHPIPAGPLREHVAHGLARADALVISGEDEYGLADVAENAAPGLPRLTCRPKPGPELPALVGKPVFAFAGIGHPEKFFSMLSDGNCNLVGARAFDDHHAFKPGEIDALKRQAEAMGAVPVTTEKDHARLGPDQTQGIQVLTMTLEWDDEAALTSLLATA